MSDPLTGSKREKRKVSYPPDFHRETPHDADAEKGVLASCLLAPKEVIGLAVESGVVREAFYIPAHGEIFEALLALWNAGKPVDFITLAGHLRDACRLDQVGGAPALNDLFTFIGTAANAGWYVEIVLEKWLRRRVIAVCCEHAARGYEDDETARLIDDVERAIFEISQQRAHGKSRRRSAKELAIAAIGTIEKIYASGGKITGMETGFRELDQMTDGLHGSEMIVIAARPSMGKTAFAMNIAEHVCMTGNVPVAVFSLEMSDEQLMQRMLCSAARVNIKSLRNGFLGERDFPALTAASGRLAAAPLFIDDEGTISIMDLRARARRLKAQHGIGLIVIDYLQLLRSTSRKAADNRQIEISEISAGIKGLAKELRIPIVVLAQLNRQVEQRGGGRPRLSDLRESGSIEQDADVVGLLVREEYYAEGEEAKAEAAGKATLIIAKQRNGPVGDVPLTFIKEYTRFEDRAREAAPC
jgi:replicative DNA helicase